MKHFTVFTFRKDDVDKFNLLKTIKMNLEKTCLNHKINLKQTTITLFFLNFKLHLVNKISILHMS